MPIIASQTSKSGDTVPGILRAGYRVDPAETGEDSEGVVKYLRARHQGRS